MTRINRVFSGLQNGELKAKTEVIIRGLTSNRAFPAPSPTAAVLAAALSDFKTALVHAKSPARREKAIAATRNVLEILLEKLAANLELTPHVTEAQLATIGFDLRKNGARRRGPVAAPTNVRGKPTGTSGEVQVLCRSVGRAAKVYQVQFTQDPNGTQWIDAGTFGSTRGMIIRNLTRAKDYWFRVRAIGPGGPGAWSDAATILVS